MSTQTLSSIVEQLVAEERRLNQEVERLRTQLKVTDQQLSKVRKAAASLGMSVSTSPAKPTASLPEVKRLILQCLNEKRESTDEEIQAWVEKRLTEKGISRTGFSKRFQRAMKDVRNIFHPNMEVVN